MPDEPLCEDWLGPTTAPHPFDRRGVCRRCGHTRGEPVIEPLTARRRSARRFFRRAS
ncbi:hypothetical protein [Streptomyces sp. RFCAC02]|uniref:hypothetical protein n=1 Tax=Streptomyces sp. RFCAC02 TaxID=2499143 RepID=UPI00143D8172|nr:hypothetical protein [Streptomyces sp. RFCAC02]